MVTSSTSVFHSFIVASLLCTSSLELEEGCTSLSHLYDDGGGSHHCYRSRSRSTGRLLDMAWTKWLVVQVVGGRSAQSSSWLASLSLSLFLSTMLQCTVLHFNAKHRNPIGTGNMHWLRDAGRAPRLKFFFLLFALTLTGTYSV